MCKFIPVWWWMYSWWKKLGKLKNPRMKWKKEQEKKVETNEWMNEYILSYMMNEWMVPN